MKIRGNVLGCAFLLVVCFMTSAVIAADTTGVTDNEVRIGLFYATTGGGSVFGIPVSNSIITIFNQVNEAGGIHGRKIKVFLEDDAGNPEKAKAAVKKLIHDTKVFALMGTGTSLAAYAAKMEIEAAKVPWLGAPAIMDKIYLPLFPTTFGFGLMSRIDGQSAAKFMLTKPGVKKIAFAYLYDDWGKALLEAAEKVLENTQVQHIKEVVEKGTTDATAVILKIKKFEPDAVCGILYPSEGAVFTRDCYKYGLKVPMVFVTASSDLEDMRVRTGIPESMKWVFANSYGKASISDPQFADLVKALKSYFPKDKPWSQNFIGIAGGRIVVEVLKRVGRNLTREKFLDALENLKDFETEVLSSKISYSKTDHTGIKECVMVTLRKDGIEYYLPKLQWDPDILKKKNWE
jgi:branched-chain amino acid transport system substrate-binding protein